MFGGRRTVTETGRRGDQQPTHFPFRPFTPAARTLHHSTRPQARPNPSGRASKPKPPTINPQTSNPTAAATVISSHLISSHLISSHLISSHLMSCHVMCDMSYMYVMSCHAMSCTFVMSCYVMDVLERHLIPYMSCHERYACLERQFISCHVMSSFASKLPHFPLDRAPCACACCGVSSVDVCLCHVSRRLGFWWAGSHPFPRSRRPTCVPSNFNTSGCSAATPSRAAKASHVPQTQLLSFTGKFAGEMFEALSLKCYRETNGPMSSIPCAPKIFLN